MRAHGGRRCRPFGLVPLFLVILLPLLGACRLPGPGAEAEGTERPLFSDLAAFTQLPERPVASASSEFWEWWGDGRAELSGYQMTVQHYGEPREAELALIYVTEPHDRRTWIKDDDASSPERVEVLKLNRNAAFLTGSYPYAVMTSVFAPVDRYRDEAFAPVRIVHQAQEWCGAYSHLVWPGRNRFRSLRLSYFAQHGERIREVDVPGEVLYEDALLVQLRELDGPFAGGGDWEGLLVPELWRVRSMHGSVDPVPATIVREEGIRRMGQEEHPITRFTLESDGYRRIFEVEREVPRRVLGWTTSTGEEAEILATERLPYWELNRLGDESVREALGLSPHGLLPPGGEAATGGACPDPSAGAPPEAGR
ncbi:MAG: hypothetical protein WD960_01070 [Gemmatimonadota bacterium]